MTTYLVIGSGGREHAIAWKLSTETGARVFVVPGSAAIAATDGVSVFDLPVNDHPALASFAREHHVDVTIVGPEAPLVAGLGDHFRREGLRVVGPGSRGAELEGSKAFAKDVMIAAGVPTADFALFHDVEEAVRYVKQAAHPLVLKADGLAGGKGVVISRASADSVDTLREFMTGQRFGAASQTVLIEEFLEGPELSLMVLTDGERIAVLPTSRDHKRLLDEDAGPNTGGMGAVTPSPDEKPGLLEELVELVIRPTLAELRRRGIDYSGFLYAGLMLTAQGPKVLEFNVRLGDPETQALMCALTTDVGLLLTATASGALSDQVLAGTHACCIVLASAGYPGSPRVGDPIEFATPLDARVFHSGTKAEDERWLTASGRVVSVVGRGPSAESARENAYKNADRITWTGRHMRRDIGV